MNHIVALSGGKDSTACALLLRRLHPNREFTYISTPVGNEPPEVPAFLDYMEGRLQQPILRLGPRFAGSDVNGYRLATGEDGLADLIRRQKAIPNFRMRFCTRMLKIEPTLFYLAEQTPCVQYVGLRADEPMRAGIAIEPKKFQNPLLKAKAKDGAFDQVQQAYPLRHVGFELRHVLEEVKGVPLPWRTDCMLCYHQRISDWHGSWERYPEQLAAGGDIETESGHTFRSPGRDTWPLPIVELTEEFEAGRVPKDVEKRKRQQANGNESQRFLIQECNEDMDSQCRVCTL